MSNRFIKIEKCSDCPKCNHKGAFGAVAYIPICRAVCSELPYTTHAVERNGQRLHAIQTPGIPDWCPLSILPEGL